jgi:hypothetical protein
MLNCPLVYLKAEETPVAHPAAETKSGQLASFQQSVDSVDVAIEIGRDRPNCHHFGLINRCVIYLIFENLHIQPPRHFMCDKRLLRTANLSRFTNWRLVRTSRGRGTLSTAGLSKKIYESQDIHLPMGLDY